MQAFLKFNKWLWKISGLKYPDDFDPQTEIPLHAKLARAHDAWIDRVKRSVPRDKLLVFQPRDGWKPLCDFVSPVDAGVAAKCADILASGEVLGPFNDLVQRTDPLSGGFSQVNTLEFGRHNPQLQDSAFQTVYLKVDDDEQDADYEYKENA